MNVIRKSIERPIAVIAAVLMTLLLGWLALQTIPIQLTPDVNRPVITIRTSWSGAAPAEIEREITNRQEEVLKGINGLASVVSGSRRGSARVTLEFEVGTNMDRVLLLVANRLDRVSGYPDEADEPTLSMAGAEDNAIAYFILSRKEANERPIHEYGQFLEDVIQERIERVPGVSEVTVYGGSDPELQVIVKPGELASYQLTVSQIVQALRRANVALSAGEVNEGKRRYTVRTEAKINTVEAIKSVVLRSEHNPLSGRVGRVTVDDVAEVKFAYADPTSMIRQFGKPALVFNAKRETGANVIETMSGIRKAISELNENEVPKAGLTLHQVYDETVYISSAINLVRQNIWYGGSLAAIILFIFLRSWRATLIVSIAIPVSVIGSFVAMAALGRSLNVISLAGLAFAVGMVVDAAIVVLENIFRHREKGVSATRAAHDGAQQVWGAVFVSALTTVMVFIPILVMEIEIGQLFRDIAVAISVSVLLSLLVSVTVLPSLASGLLARQKQRRDGSLKRLSLPGIDHFANWFSAAVVGYARLMLKRRGVALLVVVLVSISTSFTAWQWLPELEYLPKGNRNNLSGHLVPPPGYNLETMKEIATRFEKATEPLWIDATGQDSKPGETPKIDRFYFVAFAGGTIVGAAAKDPKRASELVDPLNRIVARDPDMLGGVVQYSLFGRGFGGSRRINLDITGPDLPVIYDVAAKAASRVFAAFPREEGNSLRPRPALSLGEPELRIIPNRALLADAGVSTVELGQSIDAFNDGLRVAQITVGNSRIDLMLKGQADRVTQTQGIESLPVVTSQGQIVPVSSLAKVVLTAGPTQIRHKDSLRTVSLQITPNDSIALETALDKMQTQVMASLRNDGLPPGVSLRLSGSANKLAVTWTAMQSQLLIALIIVYLVMAVLFESFIYPFIIMLSVPLAAAGGVGGLAVLNLIVFQKLDMLTMLGFIILIGIVVNNAILLIHQTLFHIRQESRTPNDAIIEATRNRIRPIFMSTLTSIFGMLPLVLLPGAGSELYRGLGSVVVGGLSLSALFSLVVIPPMLSIVVGPLEARRTAKRQAREAHAAPAE